LRFSRCAPRIQAIYRGKLFQGKSDEDAFLTKTPIGMLTGRKLHIASTPFRYKKNRSY
jgi:hypothetical protein